MTSYFSISE